MRGQGSLNSRHDMFINSYRPEQEYSWAWGEAGPSDNSEGCSVISRDLLLRRSINLTLDLESRPQHSLQYKVRNNKHYMIIELCLLYSSHIQMVEMRSKIMQFNSWRIFKILLGIAWWYIPFSLSLYTLRKFRFRTNGNNFLCIEICTILMALVQFISWKNYWKKRIFMKFCEIFLTDSAFHLGN